MSMRDAMLSRSGIGDLGSGRVRVLESVNLVLEGYKKSGKQIGYLV